MGDYSALAQRVSLEITGIRGCLMLSRDGMVLGAHPEGEMESLLRSSWVRFAGLGDPERSYVEFPDQTWAFVRRGGYAAFAVADAGVRPGVLVDLLEQSLMAGERERVRDRETMRLPEVPSAPSGKPRTSLHKPERPESPEPATAAPAEVRLPASGRAGSPRGSMGSNEEVARPSEPATIPEGTTAKPAPDAPPEPEGPGPSRSPGADEETEVDRILLAKEFAGLLQVPKEDDEASR